MVVSSVVLETDMSFFSCGGPGVETEEISRRELQLAGKGLRLELAGLQAISSSQPYYTH